MLLRFCLGSLALLLAGHNDARGAERVSQPFQQTRGSIIALVGCIPMVPGSMATKGLTNLFTLLQARPGEKIAAATNWMRNLLEVTLTLAAIGTALAIPQLIYPEKEASGKTKPLRSCQCTVAEIAYPSPQKTRIATSDSRNRSGFVSNALPGSSLSLNQMEKR